MIRDILPASDPRLRQVSKPVSKIDKKTLELISDLKETLLAQKDPEGVGLAAPQIGKNVRVFVAKIGKNLKVVINPQILHVEKIASRKIPARKGPKPASEKKDKRIMEGCLSLINFYGPLKRSEKIRLEYLGEDGKVKVETFTGFSAQIIQHEIDHLQGILFVDRLIEQKKPLFELVGDEWEKVEI